jgi:hypothetical protein
LSVIGASLREVFVMSKTLFAAALLLLFAAVASGQDPRDDEPLATYLRTGRYADARALIDELLRANPARDDLRNVRAVFGGGANMSVRRAAGTFQCEVSSTGVLLPLQINGKRVDWLADTGANFSMISDAEAGRLGLTIRDSEGRVADLAGGSTGVRVAVVPRMSIGRTQLRDVTFMVFPAGEMPWKALPAGKQGILGLPPLLALDTLSWTRSGECRTASAVVARQASGTPLRFAKLQVIATVTLDTRPLEFVLDTGNQAGTQLWARFGKEFESRVREHGRPGTVRVTQIGGDMERPVTLIPDVRLIAGGMETVLPEAHLFAKPVGDDQFHGLLGMDVLSQAGTVQIDFKKMTLVLSRE